MKMPNNVGKTIGMLGNTKKHWVILRKHWTMCCKMLRDGMEK
jgi:hypothetical protein